MRYISISETEAESYRKELDTVVVRGRSTASNNGSKSKDKLHIPADTERPAPLCNAVSHSNKNWKEKDIAVYPSGHKSICKRCVATLKDESNNSYKQFSDRELLTHLESVQHKAPLQNLSKTTYNEYREENQPSASTIAKRFGSWTTAKAKTEYDP